MTPDPFSDDLKAYCDGELPWLRRRAVRRHLTRCASCREEISQMTQIAEDLCRPQPSEALDSALRARILGTAFADVQGPVFNARRVRRAQDQVLKFCFSASVAINLLFVFWVGHSSLFRSAATLAELRERQIKVLQPVPVAHPSPRPAKTPPPSKPKETPPLKPLRAITHIAPHPSPATRPPRTQPVAVTRGENAPLLAGAPAIPGSAVPGSAVPTPPEPPTKQESGSFADKQQTKKEQIQDLPPPNSEPVAEVQSPPTPPKPAAPAEERDEPEILGNINDIYLPQFDPDTIAVLQITASWDVDERGHTSHIRLSPQTSGNLDVDSAIRDSIHKFRFKPRIHNGQPQPAHINHTFTISN